MPRVSKKAIEEATVTAGKTTATAANLNKSYMSNGVMISPAVPSVGDKIKIVYDGLLSKSGATHVYAHVGFGNRWDSTYDYPMSRTAMGFEANIPVSRPDTLNLCFKDCANNWDNNSGKNYLFEVTQ